MVTRLEALAEWLAALSPPQVPATQHELARLRILDTLGLIAAGAAQTAGASTARWAAHQASSTSIATSLVTPAPVAAATAALVHGTLAHARDFDDTFADSVIHPGSTAISTALAVAESRALPFYELTTAIVAGYETAARLGRIAGRGFHARGFHATSVIGPVAAAATAGVLMRLDAGQIADAMGLATSMSAGTMAFLADGGWSKWLHTGWSAHGGIVAAGLAAGGFRGPRHVLEHGQGLYGAFLGRVPDDLESITRGLGAEWLGTHAQFKLYPCAHVIHPFIEAALRARGELGLAAGQVNKVICDIPPWAMPIVAEPRAPKIAPRNDLEAIASLPFMVAAALRDGRVDLTTLGSETLAREDLRALAMRIECRPDPALTVGFDGRIAIELSDGTHRELPAVLPDATPERVTAKFRANAALGGMTRADEVQAALRDPGVAVRDLMRLASLARPENAVR